MALQKANNGLDASHLSPSDHFSFLQFLHGKHLASSLLSTQPYLQMHDSQNVIHVPACTACSVLDVLVLYPAMHCYVAHLSKCPSPYDGEQFKVCCR